MPGIKQELSPEPYGSSSRGLEAERYLEENDRAYVKKEASEDEDRVYVRVPAKVVRAEAKRRKLYVPNNAVFNPLASEKHRLLDVTYTSSGVWMFDPYLTQAELPPFPPDVDRSYRTKDLFRNRDPGSRPSTFDDDHRSSRHNDRSRRDRDEPRHRREMSTERRKSGRDVEYDGDRRDSRGARDNAHRGSSDRHRTRSPDNTRRSRELTSAEREGARRYSPRDRDYEYSHRRSGSTDRYRPGRDSRDSRRRDDRDDRRYRERDDRGDYDRPRQRRRTPSPRPPPRAKTPEISVDEKDSRTVFVQQLAQRVRSKDLKEFFERAGPVANASIVKDRISQRSKG